MPKPSLPVRLALLVAGTTLPLIFFAAVLVFNDYEQDRKDASQRDQLGGEATDDFLPRGVVCTVTCSLEDEG